MVLRTVTLAIATEGILTLATSVSHEITGSVQEDFITGEVS